MEAGPETLEQVLRQAGPDTTIKLRPGKYGPLRVSGIRVDPQRPIVIDGGGKATFDSGTSLKTFGPRAAKVARARMRSGHYPGVYTIADEATLTIEHCTGLEFRDLIFRDSWPTAVYIDDCRDLVFDKLDGLGSTFFIYAVGAATRNLKISNCHWLQDERLWRDVLWVDVHEKSDPEKPGNYTADRAYDGTFFCGFGIAGDIEVVDCHVEHAFNGVHLFNREHDPMLERNVHVHRCRFEFIKDNPIEPEDTAYNWWIHDNQFFNAHRWFSMELLHAGWFYIFRNRGWFTEKPGPDRDEHSAGSVFKLPETAAHVGDYPGEIHVFNNSWFLRSSIAPQGVVRKMRHHNNAIVYCDPATYKPRGVCDGQGVFGDLADRKSDPFTRDWHGYDISFVNDCVVHPQWPAGLLSAGYPIEGGFNKDPKFLWDKESRFQLPGGSNPCRGSGVVIEIPLPDGSIWKPRKPFNIGWYQDKADVFAGLRYQRMR